MGSTSEYRIIGNLLGISKASISIIISEISKILSEHIDDFVKLPQNEELDRVVNGYSIKWGFPNCAGAIDGTHIPIISPKDNHCDYFNRKGHHSVILQGVCNDKYQFTDINVGWPGRVHDARVLSNSSIFRLGTEGKLFDKTVEVNGIHIQVALLGDPAYPLLPWLLKGFADNGRLTPDQERFNYMLSKSRMTIENTFGRLKGRWRRLQKRMDFAIDTVPTVITACCIIHNICEKEKDPFREHWVIEPTEPSSLSQETRNDAPHNGRDLRQVLVDYFKSL